MFDMTSASNIEAVRDCFKLESTYIRNLSANANLRNVLPTATVRNFHLISSELEDLLPLEGVPQLAELERLTLVSCSKLKSLNGIESWSETLREISLGGGALLADLHRLAHLPKLTYLSLHRDILPHLSVIHDLTSLKELNIGSGYLVDISPLHGIRGLTIYAKRRQTILGADLLGEGSKIKRFG